MKTLVLWAPAPASPALVAWSEALPAWTSLRVANVALWQYAALGVLLLGALGARWLVRIVLGRQLRQWVGAMGQDRASRVAQAASSPAATFALALLVMAGLPGLGLAERPQAALLIACRVLMVFAAADVAYRLVDVLTARMAERAAKTESKLDDQLVPLARKSLKTLVVVAGGLFILQNLHVNVGSLLAGLGIGGLAVAFAAKETLSNVFGSVMIFIDRPFHVGDWIVVNGAEGIVEEVGFRSTRIRTFYNSVVSMPNAVFNDAKVDNYGRREFRRTYTTLNLVYDTTPEQIQAFCEGIRAIILANPHTRKDYYEVHFCGFGAHSLDVMLYFFFKVSSWSDELRERHNVYLEILRLAKELKVGFAFPTQTLHVDSLAALGSAATQPSPPEDATLGAIASAFGPSGRLARPAGPRLVPGAYLAGGAPSGDAEA